jgi:hypothetical protein
MWAAHNASLYLERVFVAERWLSRPGRYGIDVKAARQHDELTGRRIAARPRIIRSGPGPRIFGHGYGDPERVAEPATWPARQ